MNVVIYARYSSSSQREASIEEQVKVCRDYADRNDFTIIKVYSDSAISGRIADRPKLQQLLKDSSKKQFDAVLVYSIDRLGRDLEQTLTNQRLLRENNVLLLSVTENFSDEPSGVLFKNIMMAYSQFYSDELAVKIKRGMDYNAERCLSTGGNIALGFKTDKDKRFHIDPDTAPIIRMIFEMYADGKTVTEITAHLNSLGLKTSRGVPFNKNSLHTILQNKRYIGVYTYKGTEIPDGLPRIISDELFEKVSKIMDKNRKAPARSKAKEEYLLTTKLFCGHCKKMMTGWSGTGKQRKIYHYYICNGRKTKECNKKMVDKHYIENLVVSECRRLLSAENIRRITTELMAFSEAEKDASNLKQLKRLLAENERKHKNTIDAIMESDLESVRKALGEKIPKLEAEHEELEKLIAVESEPYPTLSEQEIRFFLIQLKKGNIADIKYRKMLINIFVNKIYLYDDKITITYNSGDEEVTISDELLSALEEREASFEDRFREDRLLFLSGKGPPKQDKSELFTIGDVFGFIVYIEEIEHW